MYLNEGEDPVEVLKKYRPGTGIKFYFLSGKSIMHQEVTELTVITRAPGLASEAIVKMGYTAGGNSKYTPELKDLYDTKEELLMTLAATAG